MAQGSDRLRAIRGDVASLLALLAAEQSLDTVGGPIRTGLSKALAFEGEGFFSIKASDAAAKSFHALCAEIHALPEEYRDFVARSLRLIGTGPGTLGRWVRRLPHPFVLPEAAKAFDLALSMILGETPADSEMRVFHLMAGRFAKAARMAASGTAWTSVERPARPVMEYDEAASSLRDEMLAQFSKLDGRHLALMDDRLRRYRPLRFSPDMASPGHVNTQEERQRIIDLNERALSESRPYQTGEAGIVTTMEALARADVRAMSDIASFVAYATDLYFGEDVPLMTLSVASGGEVEALVMHEPSVPALH